MRSVKLDFYDHLFTRPICKADIIYTSMHTVIISSQRKCPSCKDELLVEQGAAKAISDKKLPKREGLATAIVLGNGIRVRNVLVQYGGHL